WEGWAILLRQKQKKLIMLPSETMIWQPEFTDKTLSRKPGAVHTFHQVAKFSVPLQGQKRTKRILPSQMSVRQHAVQAVQRASHSCSPEQ
ncbi:hypothetical protein, partial [Escherichia coli]|uniref:hypothetical protein n=1 Tax=Escherichia coli TaxID=562 RepID=UPI001BE4B40C